MWLGAMDLEDADKAIKRAWIAGIIVIIVTSALAFISLKGHNFLGIHFDKQIFLDLSIFAVLTFGIYRKSRACAGLLLVYFILGKIALFMEMKEPAGIGASLIWTFYFFQGFRGTLSYHRIAQEKMADVQNKPEAINQKIAIDKSQTQPVSLGRKKFTPTIISLAVMLIGLSIYWKYQQTEQAKTITNVSTFKEGTSKLTLYERIIGKTQEELEVILGEHINEGVTGREGTFYREYTVGGKTVTVFFEKGRAVGSLN
jgi:serine/threonine-protein kinase